MVSLPVFAFIPYDLRKSQTAGVPRQSRGILFQLMLL